MTWRDPYGPSWWESVVDHLGPVFGIIALVGFIVLLAWFSMEQIKEAERDCAIIHATEKDPVRREALINICVRSATRHGAR